MPVCPLEYAWACGDKDAIAKVAMKETSKARERPAKGVIERSP
jgi:hypothetical protein